MYYYLLQKKKKGSYDLISWFKVVFEYLNLDLYLKMWILKWSIWNGLIPNP